MKTAVLILLFYLVPIRSAMSQQSVEKLNDSAMAIYKQNPKQAVAILEEALKQSRSNTKLYSFSQNNLAIVYRDLGQFEKARSLSEKALKQPRDSFMMASAYNNIGASARSLGNYEASLAAYLNALHIYEKKNAFNEIATVNNNIGIVYGYLGITEKAVQYHLKAIAIFEKENKLKGISEAYNNIAIIYANDGALEKALDYFQYSLAIEEQLKDRKGIAESANNVGAVFYYMQKIDSAMVYFRQSAAIEKSIGNLAGVSASYNNMAQVLIENQRLDESKKYIDSAYQYAKVSKTAVDIETALYMYSQYYEARKDTKTALKYYKDYSTFRDSILNVDTNAKVAKLEIEYQTEKKEKEILSQRADLAEKELDLNTKNYYILGLIALAIVLSLLGFLLYNQQKLKNRQLRKENELKDALIKIETQNRLQEQRLRISRDLHDNIGAQLTFIISSLDNLKYGFQLPENLSKKLKTISDFTTATIYELRDTIWAMNKNEISLEDLRTRISNLIEKATASTDSVHFGFENDDNLPKQLKFNSVEGMNLYRILQEAINNALKYAEATSIKVQFLSENNTVKLVIKDDGKGFDEQSTTFGNGINNMKKRADEINAKLELVTDHGTGTTISLVLPYTIYDE